MFRKDFRIPDPLVSWERQDDADDMSPALVLMNPKRDSSFSAAFSELNLPNFSPTATIYLIPLVVLWDSRPELL